MNRFVPVALSLVALSAPSIAQWVPAGPMIQFGRIVATGEGDRWVKEPDIAVGGGRAMVVFMHGAPDDGVGQLDDIELRYSYFNGDRWQEGTVFGGPGIVAGDPAIVYDPVGRQFVISFYAVVPGEFRDVYSRNFSIDTGDFVNTAELVFNTDDPPVLFDKPWLALGQVMGDSQQVHLTAFKAGFDASVNELHYARSSDAGLSWEILTPVPSSGGSRLDSIFAPQVAVPDSSPGAPLFAVRTKGNGNWKFHEHSADGLAGQAEFVPLGITVAPRLSGDRAPRTCGTGVLQPVPYLTADPSSRDRFYIVYNDKPLGGANTDLDVFCVRADRDEQGNWTRSAAVRVNDNVDGSGPISDQFCQAAAVDAAGRVHVVFYDGREYANDPTCDDENARFDLFYAVSDDGGASFDNYRVPNVHFEPALSESLQLVDGQGPGEYPGITVSDDGTVWMAYSGTSSQDPTGHKSVIWVSRVIYP